MRRSFFCARARRCGARSERVALQLSGHTHGGSVRLFGWSPVVPSRYGNRLAYGHARSTATSSSPEPRLQHHADPSRCSPEIVLVTVADQAGHGVT